MKLSATINELVDPLCPTCDCVMWVSEIEPAKPRYDRRTYVCPRCQHVEVMVVQFRNKKRRKEPAISDAN
jgi:hypothetical protein